MMLPNCFYFVRLFFSNWYYLIMVRLNFFSDGLVQIGKCAAVRL